jgi:NAD(P)-dependent dehydrogenase (short-subunit alcohol dehydrogenase family)
MPSRPVVLVTGAARRLGRAIALELATHGFDVAVHYRTSAAEAEVTIDDLRRVGAAAEAFAADLADEAACRALVPAVLTHLQRLDAVVNNASTAADDGPASFGHAAMEAHWRANAAPAVLLAQALHEHLGTDEARTGCVVNLLDQRLWNPDRDFLSYTLSKAALQAATVTLALALAPRVRVCGVAPGVTVPPGPIDEPEFAAAHRLTPLQRATTPEDVAQAVRFLIESPAITGTTLLVDGGQHLWGRPRDVATLVGPGRED